MAWEGWEHCLGPPGGVQHGFLLPRSSETLPAQGAEDSGYSDVGGAEICTLRALKSVSVECGATLLERAVRVPCPRRIWRPGPLRCIFSLLCTGHTHTQASTDGTRAGVHTRGILPRGPGTHTLVHTHVHAYTHSPRLPHSVPSEDDGATSAGSAMRCDPGGSHSHRTQAAPRGCRMLRP